MRKSFLMFLPLLLCSLSAGAQGLTAQGREKSVVNPNLSGVIGSASSVVGAGRLFSPSVGRKFYEMAYELANSEDVNGPAVEQAIAFLTAAMKLESGANDVQSLLIKLACRDPERDYSGLVYSLLADYVDESADIEVAKKAVGYLLERQNSREEREKLLEEMLRNLGNKNVVLSSELAILLGLLKAEKADLRAATFYFMQAYKNNRYNRLAFAKLAELMPEQIGPEIYLERLRLALRENPLDIEVALTFAQYAERLELYETAVDVYEYCADLFGYLYPSEPLPSRIYLPWAISSYNTQQNQSKCLQIAERIRQDGRFDLLLEAVAGKAAAKIGDGELATRIFQAAEEKAQRLLFTGLQGSEKNLGTPDDSSSQKRGTKQLTWFYCFALPLPSKALYWANKAYADESDSAAAAAFLAYALMMNNQMKWAKPLIENYERNQIADLTLAQIQLTEGQKDSAIETLKSVIAKDPGSFAAERAKEILVQQGGEYIPPVDPDVTLTALKNKFGKTIVPTFAPAEQIISVQFNIRGKEFSYGSEFDGVVSIINNSSEPLVISNDGLFKGNIRVDADISGDISKKIPNLVSTRIRPALPLEPGRSTLISLRLVTGELGRTLLAYPQASLDIEFTLYLDPVPQGQTDEGKVTNRLTHIEPTKVRVKRPGVELTSKYLTNRFNSISKGHFGQKVKTAQLFIGLLTEQHMMSNRKPPYRFIYADWMPSLLRTALIHESGLLRNPANDEWLVKVHTMAEMLSLPLDHELITAVAENLYNVNWPVRMMAIYLLSKGSDSKFDKVLDWMAKYDPSEIVRDMAVALGSSHQSSESSLR